MEQLLAIVILTVFAATLFVIFLPSAAEKLGAMLKLSKWTPLSDDDLLIFVLLFPIWSLFGATKVAALLAPRAITERLQLSKWTPLSDENLLVFLLLLPVWLFWGATKLYWNFVDYIVNEREGDDFLDSSRAGIVVFFAAVVLYLVYFVRPILIFLVDLIGI